MSLRQKILIPLLAILVFGFAGLGYGTIKLVTSSLENSILQSVQREGQSIFRSMDRMMSNAERNLLYMSEDPVVIEFAVQPEKNRALMQKTLESFVKRLDLFHAVGFVSKEGYLLASSALKDASQGDAILAKYNRKNLQGPLQNNLGHLYLGYQEQYVASLSGKIGVSDIFQSATGYVDGTFPPITVVAVPVLKDDQIVGALFASLDLTKFGNVFLKINKAQDDSLQMILLNGKNQIVMHPDPHRLFTDTGADVQSIRGAKDHQIFRFEENGFDMLGFRMDHPNGRWVLAVIGKEEVLLKPVYVLRNILIFAFVVMVVLVSGIAYRMVGGVFTRITKVMRFASDVSSGKLDAAIPEKSSDELGMLAHAVEQMVHNLVIMLEKSEASSKSKSDFLARMSHEIRTPMNAIMGMTYLCLQTPLSPQQTGYLRKVSTACKNLLVVINDVLDFSKIEAGKMVIENVPFSLNCALDTIVDMMSIKAAEKDLFFNIHKDVNVPDKLIGAEGRLLQILVNLCGNAMKFTENGGVDVTVTAQFRDDNKCTLSFLVHDTGIGIAQKDLENIFSPFEQAEGTATRKFEGTGLGLAISQRLVELLGGKIWVKSVLGQGSEFGFSIPLIIDVECKEISCHGDLGDTSVLQGKKVLLVEDNFINQEIASEMLQSVGIQVDIANNGNEGVLMAGAAPYDIILMDIAMPLLDGFEASRKIRAGAGPNAKYTPIIALTAHAFAEDKDKSTAAGMNDYLTKPIDYNELLKKLMAYS